MATPSYCEPIVQLDPLSIWRCDYGHGRGGHDWKDATHTVTVPTLTINTCEKHLKLAISDARDSERWPHDMVCEG